MSKFNLSQLTSGLLLAVLTVGAQAAEVTQATDTVKGRAPIADSVTVENLSTPGSPVLVVGSIAHAGYNFTDADNDVENGTAFQWLRDGAVISGATQPTYTVQAEDFGSKLKVEVLPKTSSSTTDPSEGAMMASQEINVSVGYIPANWIMVNQGMPWELADSYCKNLGNGARLPTVAELQDLFVVATRSPTYAPNSGYITNNDLEDYHGWWGASRGNGYERYWSSEQSDATYYKSVVMTDGSVYWDNKIRGTTFACIR